MGAAARANPRASGSPDDVALARLRAGAAQLTRYSFERCLFSYPAEHRDQVRALLQPFCPWTVAHRRERRLALEAMLYTRRAQAIKVANG